MNIRELENNNGAVILTEKVADVNTVIRGMNRFEEKRFAGIRVKSLNDAAFELICAKAAEDGQTGRYVYADASLQRAFLYRIICEENYSNKPSFVPESSVCIETAAEILRVMNLIRENRVTDSFKNAVSGKAAELKKLIGIYEKRLTDNGYLDDAMLMDGALDAMQNIAGSENPSKKLNTLIPWCNFKLFVAEIPNLSRKKEKFLTELFRLAGMELNDRRLELCRPEKEVSYKFFKGFGSENEMRSVVSQIQENELEYGDIALIYAGDNYENIIRSQFECAQIPYTFSTGFHAMSDPHVAMMLSILKFAENDFSYETLRDVVHSGAFALPGAIRNYRNLLREGIGWGKDRYDDFYDRFEERQNEWNKEDHSKEEIDDFENLSSFVSALKMLTDILDSKNPATVLKGILEFTDRYSFESDEYSGYIRGEIKSEIKVLENTSVSDDPIDFLKKYLEGMSISESAEPGKVMVMSYANCKAFDRKNVFVIGLGRENIEKIVTESPVVSDDELFGYAEGFLDPARERNLKKRENFLHVLDISFAENAWIGYSYYDTVQFLQNAPSMLYTDMLTKAGKTREDWGIGYGSFAVSSIDITLSKDNFYDSWDYGEEDEETAEAESDTAVSDDLENGYEDNELDGDGSDEDEWGDDWDDDDFDVEEDDEEVDENDGSDDEIAKLINKNAAHISASGLQTMLGCPLKYHYQKHKYIGTEEQISRNGYSWLDAKNKGNLFHHTMEEYCNAALISNESEDLDEKLLEKCFEHQSKEMLKYLPAPSTDVFESEKKDAYEVIKRYANALHSKLKKNKSLKVLGCETPFDGIEYEKIDEYNDPEYKLIFRGSADRVDGYVEEGILYLSIIDYKTGNKDNLEKKIENHTQIQHFVYAAGVIKWAKENKDSLEKRFGTTISDIKIYDMQYEFPYADTRGEIASCDGGKHFDGVDPTLRSGELHFPDTIDTMLEETESPWQLEDPEAVKNIAAATKELIPNKGTITMKDLGAFCTYCDYTDICRLRLQTMAKEVK